MPYYTDPDAWQRLYVGPLSPYIDTFAQRLLEQGYAQPTSRTKLNLVATLSEWLQRHRLGVETLDEQRINAFLHDLFQRQGHAYRGAPATLGALLEQLRQSGVIAAPPAVIDTSALAQLERDFAQYLAQERGLATATVVNYVPFIRCFLTERFGHRPLGLDQLRVADVSGFVLRHAPTLSPGRAKLLVTALRSFFRFLRQRGDLELDLAAAVPTVANWRLATLPRFLEPLQVERLLQSCDQCTAVGQRDYTVLLLLARLGLRAGEVVHLCLDDFDWDAGLLTVRGKGGRSGRLPLPADVGEAVVTYLRYGRPRCATRRVFVRMQAPRVGFASSVAICSILRRALKRAGLEPTFKGSHLLRHSLATQLLRNGASLAQIGELLRHRLPHTTEIYAKVDQAALSALAQPWPGGAS
jgi:site-specific recombinase XerD